MSFSLENRQVFLVETLLPIFCIFAAILIRTTSNQPTQQIDLNLDQVEQSLKKYGIKPTTTVHDLLAQVNQRLPPGFEQELHTVYSPHFLQQDLPIFDMTIFDLTKKFFELVQSNPEERFMMGNYDERIGVFLKNLKNLAVKVVDMLQKPMEQRTYRVGLNVRNALIDDEHGAIH